jgi:hypothetical protein
MRPVKILCAAVVMFGMAACSNDLKVTSVEPPQGTFGGGEDVVIHGNGFQPGRGGVTVTFGKKPATSVVVASGDKINVMTPGGDANTTVDVTVIFDDGKAFKLANGFHYMAPADQRGTLDKAFNTLGNGASGTTATPKPTTPTPPPTAAPTTPPSGATPTPPPSK